MEDKNTEQTINAAQHLESRQKLNFCYEEKRELYKIFRSQVEHEDHLVNQRLTWMLLSQAFLFAAYFSALNTYLDFSKTIIYKNILFLILLFTISMGGLALVFFGFRSINGAFEAIKRIRRQWYYHFPEEGDAYKDNNVDFTFVTPDPGIILSKQFPDITFVGDIKYNQRIEETERQTEAEPKIKSFYQTFKLIFFKGIGSRTTAFGTPMIIFLMWSSLLLLQIVYLFIRMRAS